VKVVIKDVDLIDQDKLKELALDGAYLAGSQLQITMGASSNDFARQISEATK
jgi:phosphotransferase system IIB component